MQSAIRLVCAAALMALLLDPGKAFAQVPQSKFAEVNGVKLHYLIAGKGDPVVLLHGYAETSHMWLPLISKLADKHTVIAPDLRGFGESAAPPDGYTKAAMAQDIHALPVAIEHFDAEALHQRDLPRIVIDQGHLETLAAQQPGDDLAETAIAEDDDLVFAVDLGPAHTVEQYSPEARVQDGNGTYTFVERTISITPA